MIIGAEKKRKPGRPRGIKFSKRLQFRIDPETLREFDRILKKMKITRGRYLRGIIHCLIDVITERKTGGD